MNSSKIRKETDNDVVHVI